MPPRLARLLAVLVAIALVVGAFALRGALSDDDEDDVTTGGGTPDGDASYRVLCDEDLGAACDAMEDVLGYDVDRVTAQDVLTAETSDGDAWVTLDPMPAMLDGLRESAGLPPLTVKTVALASSRLSLLVRSDVGCPDGAWSCVAGAAADQKVGVPADDTATGQVSVGAGFAGLAPDQEERGIGALDEDTRPAMQDLVDSGDRFPLDVQQDRFLTQPGLFAAIVTTEALAADAIGGPRGNGLTSVPLTPETTIGVVLVGLGASGDDAVRALGEAVSDQTVLDALGEAGWDGEPAASDGLPDPDVIYALQEALG